jgi:hypothetical protein
LRGVLDYAILNTMRAWAIRSVCVWTLGLGVLIWWGRQGPPPAGALAPDAAWADIHAARARMADAVMGSLPHAAAAPAKESGYRPGGGGVFLPRNISGAGSAGPIVSVEPFAIMPQTPPRRENDLADLAGPLGEDPVRDWGWLNATIRETERLDGVRDDTGLSGRQAGWELLDPGARHETLPMDRMLESGMLPGTGTLFDE